MSNWEAKLSKPTPVTDTGAFCVAPKGRLIGLHFGPKADVAAHDELLNRHYRGIIEAVHNQGEEVVITRGKGHFNVAEGTVDELWLPELSEDGLATVVSIGAVALESFGVVRDYGGQMDLLSKVIQINAPAVRELVDVKSRAYDQLFRDSQAITVNLAQEFHPDMLDSIPGDTIVIKPDRGSGAANVHITTKLEAAKVIDSIPQEIKEKGLVAQEYIDMHLPFPPDVRGIDELEQAKLDAAPGQKKELRVFQFYGRNANRSVHAFLPQARVGQPGSQVLVDDYKVALDPDYLPESVLAISDQALSKTAEVTGAREIFGALDFSYGKNAEGDLAWRPVEFNAWKPVFDRGNKAVSKRYDVFVAEQLVRAAGK